MYNPTAYALGSNRSVIRELFEYGNRRANLVGRENVYDYSLGNPSIPAPPEVNQAIRDILAEMDSLSVHGYTSAVGDSSTRQAIADDLNARYDAGVGADDLFIGCGAAPELVAAFTALAVPGGAYNFGSPNDLSMCESICPLRLLLFASLLRTFRIKSLHLPV